MSTKTSLSRLALPAALGLIVAAAPACFRPLYKSGLTMAKAFAGGDDRDDDDRGRDADPNGFGVATSDGGRIEIETGRHELKDPADRTVIERPAMAADRSRLSPIIR